MLSVLICTYNRGDILAECLESVVSTYTEAFPIEVIVIDNNSTDNTSGIVQQFHSKYPYVVYHFEKAQGLSYARNAGYHKAKYDWVVYLDDDALVHDNFFERIFYLISDTDYKCIGGLYLPWYKYGQPKWYRESFGSNRKSYTALTALKSSEYVSGGIFLIQKSLLYAHNGFDVGLGMTGETVAYGEEDDLQNRLRSSGITIAYDPLLKIDHLVPQYKMDVKWFLNASYEMGKSFFAIRGYPDNKLTGIFALLIGLGQLLVGFFLNVFKLLKKDYYLESFYLDVCKKPLKWFGAFVNTWN